MNTSAMLAIDAVVCRGLGKRKGEAILDAARRVVFDAEKSYPVRRAAAILLGSDGRTSWEHMRHAAEVLTGDGALPGGGGK